MRRSTTRIRLVLSQSGIKCAAKLDSQRERVANKGLTGCYDLQRYGPHATTLHTTCYPWGGGTNEAIRGCEHVGGPITARCQCTHAHIAMPPTLTAEQRTHLPTGHVTLSARYKGLLAQPDSVPACHSTRSKALLGFITPIPLQARWGTLPQSTKQILQSSCEAIRL